MAKLATEDCTKADCAHQQKERQHCQYDDHHAAP
jgi:hypothetical protein